MNAVRNGLLWAGLGVLALGSIVAFLAVIGALLTWPLQTTSALAAVAAITVGVLAIARRRFAAAEDAAGDQEPELEFEPDTAAEQGRIGDAQLREILGEELFEELNAITG